MFAQMGSLANIIQWRNFLDEPVHCQAFALQAVVW